MKQRSTLLAIAVVSLLVVSAVPAFAVLPVVNTFDVPATAVSPIPITAFTASDSDGTVTGYIVTESSTKPSPTAAGWTSAPWSSYTTTKTGSLSLYAYARDNANGVSANRRDTVTVGAAHEHPISQVTGLSAVLAAKADVGALNAYQKKYAQVIVVSADGNGDFTSPVDAMDAITDAGATNPYLVKIMPGVYDIGTAVVQMKSYVDIEGSGQDVTVIAGSGSSSSAVIHGASNAGLRFLSIRNTDTGANGNCGIINSGASPRISNVSIEMTDATLAVNLAGISNQSASPILENVAISLVGGSYSTGIGNDDSAPVVRNVTIALSGATFLAQGIHLLRSSPSISDSTIIVKDGGDWSYGIRCIQTSAPTLTNTTVKALGVKVNSNSGMSLSGK